MVRKHTSRFSVLAILAIAGVVAGVVAVGAVLAAKPPGGGGGTTAKYSVIDLGAMTRAHAITEKDAAGKAWIAGEGTQGGFTAAMAAQVSATGVLQLKYLPEPDRDVILPNDLPFEGFSSADDVNEAGDIVGAAAVYDPNAPAPRYSTGRPAFWENDGTGGFTYNQLELLVGDSGGGAYGINNQGFAVGNSFDTVSQSSRAVLWDTVIGTVLDLNDLLPAGSGWELGLARDINDSNQLCGIGWLDGVRQGYRFDLETLEIVAVPNLSPQSADNDATRLNLHGHVVGWSETDQFLDGGGRIRHGFLWKGPGQQPIDLGSLTTLESFAQNINNQGAIVGHCGLPLTMFGVPDSLATRWDNDGQAAVALEKEVPDKPSWHLRLAFGINEAGWITGAGKKTFRGVVTYPGYVLVPTGQ